MSSFVGMSEVLHIPPGAGRSRWVFGDRYTIKADRVSTGGALGLIEALVPPGGGPPPHIHHGEAEAFYLIDGVLRMRCDERTVEVEPGSFVFVPSGTPHGFTNVSAAECRMLIMFLPGGMESFFTELGVPAELGRPGVEQYELDVKQANDVVHRYHAEYL